MKATDKTPTTRVAVTFSADAVGWLEQEADRRAISLADLIRRLVDETRGAYLVSPLRGNR
jgi:hypothetical protein